MYSVKIGACINALQRMCTPVLLQVDELYRYVMQKVVIIIRIMMRRCSRYGGFFFFFVGNMV